MEAYLTFRIARQDFAMDARRVRGILSARELTLLEDTKAPITVEPFTCGIAALNGRDFPVIDLRAKLGLPHGSHGRQPCIVVVEVPSAHGPQLAGFIADRVSEIIHARDRDFRHGKLRASGRPREVLDPAALLGAYGNVGA